MPRTQNSSKMPNPYWETERNLTGLRRRPVFWQVWVAVRFSVYLSVCLRAWGKVKAHTPTHVARALRAASGRHAACDILSYEPRARAPWRGRV